MKCISSLYLSSAFVATALAAAPSSNAPSKPNILVILTDDQDLQMNSMNYMQGVKTHLTDQGTFFNHHFVTVSLCCPSRVNMWTGKAAHNTNVTDLQPPYGGYEKFIKEGYYNKWLPTWLQEAGYQTYFTGKLMNAHNIHNYQDRLTELDLDGHDFMIEPGTYQYLNTTFQHNTDQPQSFPGIYATDLLANKSLDWIDYAANISKPFFLAINPVNPHNNVNASGTTPPVPAERYKNLFPNAKVPRNASFNPDKPSGASWIKALHQLNDSEIASGDNYFRRRLQALQAVDDLVNRTVTRLDELKLLDNTYIIYTSDNGFHIGQHRLTPGKRCPYEEDVSVPLVIRGPGVPKGQTIDYVTSHTDITPTIVEWAGAKGPGDFDGVSIPVVNSSSSPAASPDKQAWEHVQIEFWGAAKDEETIENRTTINTYKALRVIAQDYNIFYSVWCDGDHELYEMKTDPHQMTNLYSSNQSILGVAIPKLLDRLDALTLVSKTCKGQSCYDPWSALDSSGKTKTLKDALDPSFDEFYASQPKVKLECAKGYLIQNEMPINYMTFGNHSSTEEKRAEAWRNWRMYTD